MWIQLAPLLADADTLSGHEWIGSAFTSREAADKFANKDRIACIEIEYADGEGL
jgi:hypothetical protein